MRTSNTVRTNKVSLSWLFIYLNLLQHMSLASFVPILAMYNTSKQTDTPMLKCRQATAKAFLTRWV